MDQLEQDLVAPQAGRHQQGGGQERPHPLAAQGVQEQYQKRRHRGDGKVLFQQRSQGKAQDHAQEMPGFVLAHIQQQVPGSHQHKA